MGEGLEIRFSQEDVKSVLDGSLTHIDVRVAKYEVGQLYRVINDETGEDVGELRMLSKKRINTGLREYFWRFEFVLELSKEEEEAIRKRLEALGYI